MKKSSILIIVVFPLFVLVVLMNAFFTYAKSTSVITVTNTNDSGTGSLRQAIMDANNAVGADSIEFNLPPNSTIVLGGSQLPIVADTLTIDGSTAVSLTVSGNNQSGVFEIGPGANVTLTHLTLIQSSGNLLYINDDEVNPSIVNVYDTHFVGNSDVNGQGVSNLYGNVTIQDSTIRNTSEGGIYNLWGTITLENSRIENNSADCGGGIYNHRGILNLQNSVVWGNYAGAGGGICNIVGTVAISDSIIGNNSVIFNGYGGGIYAIRGVTTLKHSTVISNYGGSGGGGIYLGTNLGDDGIINIEQSSIEQNSANNGGGISLEYGFVKINKSTISNNSAGSLGGGINNSDRLSITNSTIYSNTAPNFGGGIISSGRPITLTNSTISGNSASYGGGIAFVASGDLTVVNSTIINNEATVEGGGVYHDELYFIAKNSIIVNNTAPKGADCENKTSIIIKGINLFGEGTGCPVGTYILTTSNPSAEIDLTITDNGGGILTHELVTGSQAINVVTDCTDTLGNIMIQDQRGFPRPNGEFCDLGAVESGDFSHLYLPAVLKE